MKLLSGPLYFIIKLGIIAASVVILVYLSRTKIIRDSKSKVKDTIKELYANNDIENLKYYQLLLQFYDIFIGSLILQQL